MWHGGGCVRHDEVVYIDGKEAEKARSGRQHNTR